MNDQYKELTKYIRKLKSDELKTGNYPHLRANRPKAKLPPLEDHDFLNEKFRINFLFRPKLNLSKNQGNLEFGKTEIIVEYNGIFTQDFKESFSLNENNPVRVAKGEYLMDEILTPLMFASGNYQTIGRINEGMYESFVKNSLWEVNRILDYYKNLFKQGKVSIDNNKAVEFEKTREERKKYISLNK